LELLGDLTAHFTGKNTLGKDIQKLLIQGEWKRIPEITIPSKNDL